MSEAMNHFIAQSPLFENFSLGLDELFDEHVVERRQLIVLAVNQNVFIFARVLRADALNEPVSVKQLLRNGGDPHESVGIA